MPLRSQSQAFVGAYVSFVLQHFLDFHTENLHWVAFSFMSKDLIPSIDRSGRTTRSNEQTLLLVDI